ncbi:6-hydroxymethylpterin diphosphokinase MptE-like protein [Spirochaeta lutea]|uniref:6-hydroxymethylpterin diphosphokinase MptE-like domain-containing protein n=1 Tax=Spirochaeta lutea TaxID=1480694 RepID=A0A098R545_9SPIO|nr:6-hydroxymethylpterin diphosphokinase MptE-like protein [Spirochaeta lutea]KGE73842.1 hypothetical protein DC28_01110 [Spirochaeta lutea]
MKAMASHTEPQCAILVFGSPCLVQIQEFLITVHPTSRVFFVGNPEQLPAIPGLEYLGADLKTIQEKIIGINFRGLRRVCVESLGRLGSLRRHLSQIQQLFYQAFEQYWANAPSVMVLGDRWIGNILRNLSYLGEWGNSPIPQQQTALPVLLCGAGPSLARSIPLIHEYRASLFILAVDTALPILLQQGIIPDALIVLEGQMWNIYDFLPLSDRERKSLSSMVIFADISSFPSAARILPRENVHWFLSRFCNSPILDTLYAAFPWISEVPALGNVSTLGYYIAHHFIARNDDNPILLAGVDFVPSYPVAPSRGSLHHRYREYHQSRLHPLEPPPAKDSSSRVQDRDFNLFTSLAERCNRPVFVLTSLRTWPFPHLDSIDFFKLSTADVNTPASAVNSGDQGIDQETPGTKTEADPLSDFFSTLLEQLAELQALLRTASDNTEQRTLALLQELDWLFYPLPPSWSFAEIFTHRSWTLGRIARTQDILGAFRRTRST